MGKENLAAGKTSVIEPVMIASGLVSGRHFLDTNILLYTCSPPIRAGKNKPAI